MNNYCAPRISVLPDREQSNGETETMTMIDQNTSRRGMNVLIIAATCVIIIWGVNQAQSILVLFLVSSFLAIIGTSLVFWMERKGIPSVPAVVIVLLTMVIGLCSIGIVVGMSLTSFSNALPFYQARLETLIVTIKDVAASRGVVLRDNALTGYISPEAVLNFTAWMFTALSSLISNTLLIMFTLMFILLEASSFPAKLRSVLRDPRATFPQFAIFVSDIKRYVVIQTLFNLLGAVLVTIWLYILGVDFPVMWGFLAFLLYFIPSIGSIVAMIPPVLLALVQLGGKYAVLTCAGYVIISAILGNVVAPRVMGSRLGLSTLVVFVSLMFWGYLLGIVGALLCVPLTLTLKLACEASEDTRWIAVLLGPAIHPDRTPAVNPQRK
ncbi:MAG TPA: AI-2E family transporter [Bacteroidota bacterium]|nr:AI-2E family transporter [Bacteroidota bacterium]